MPPYNIKPNHGAKIAASTGIIHTVWSNVLCLVSPCKHKD